MAIEIDDIELTIKQTGADTSGLDKTSDSLRDVGNAAKSTSEKMKDVVETVKSTTSKAKECGKELAELNSKSKSGRVKMDSEEVKSATAHVQSLNNELDELGSKPIKLDVDGNIGSKFTSGLKNMADTSIGNVLNSIAQISSDGSGKIASAFSSVLPVLEKASPYITIALVGVKALTSATKAYIKVSTMPLKGVISVYKNLGERVASAVSRVKQMASSITRIIRYRAIRAALKEITEGFSTGLENAYKYSAINNSQLSKSLDGVATSMLYFKNSIGAAVAPLINALAPALDFVIDKAVELINWLNQTFATLTGQTTWMKATRAATKYSDTTDKATKKTKEFKATLLGIDEINKLNDDSSSGGGSSGSSPDPSKMFTEEKINSSTSEFAKKLKEAWEKEDFETVGVTIRDKLISMMDNIDWNKIYSKANKFGSNFAKFLNGLFKTTLNEKTGEKENVFTGLGSTIAGAVNTALSSASGFAKNFKFNKFGESVSLGIITTLQKIKWEESLSTASDWGKGIASALNGFLGAKDKKGNTVFSSLGKTVANLVKAGINGWYGFVKEFDFSGLGDKISAGINSFVNEMNATDKNGKNGWNKLIESTKLTFKGFADAISTAISGIDKKAIKEAFASAIYSALPGSNDLKTNFINFSSTVVYAWNYVVDKISKIPGFGWVEKFKVDETTLSALREEGKKAKEGLQEGFSGGVTTSVSVSFPEKQKVIKEWDEVTSPLDGRTNPYIAPKFATQNQNKKAWDNSTSGIKSITKSSTIVFPDVKKTTKAWNESTSGVKNKKVTISGTFTQTKSQITKAYNDKVSGVKNKTAKIGLTVSMSNSDYQKIKAFNYAKDHGISTTGVQKATGGVYDHGWKPITAYAGGGTPTQGQMFIAREAGPELVGTLGGHTAVMNNDQIVSSVSYGVYMANQEQIALLRQQNELLAQLAAKNTEVYASISASSIINGFERLNKRYGKTVVATR